MGIQLVLMETIMLSTGNVLGVFWWDVTRLMATNKTSIHESFCNVFNDKKLMFHNCVCKGNPKNVYRVFIITTIVNLFHLTAHNVDFACLYAHSPTLNISLQMMN